MPRVVVRLDAEVFLTPVEQAADSWLGGKAVAVGVEKQGIMASTSPKERAFCLASMAMTDLPRVRWTDAGQAVNLRADVSFVNANHLFAALSWGSVGMGYFIFGK